MEPQVRYARAADGVNIAWYAIGKGPAYVWPSGQVSSSVLGWKIPEFREIMEGIARRATLITYDARGFGLSDRGPMDFSVEATVLDMEAVTDAASPDPFTLQTFSYGSITALTYAARHPERVMALVLHNGLVRGTDMSKSWQRVRRLAEEDWDDAVRALARTNQAGYSSTVTLDQTAAMLAESATQQSFLSFANALDSWDASEVIDRVRTPSLVTHYGPRVPEIPLEASRRLAASLPNGTFASVEAAHGETFVAAATRAVISYLRDVLPPEAQRRRAPAPEPSGTAIILFADIVDSTALTERLGDAAFRAKARDLDAALRTVVRDNAGTPIDAKTLGDGVLAVFQSARQAIEAALACARAGDDAGLRLHLGLHAGDVIREEGNVFGGAVNIAARVSAIAAPGEVLVSDIVRGLARTSAGAGFEDAGERELKGVSEPVRVWRVRGG